MIVTAKPRIPFLWQFTAALCWSTVLIQYFLIGAVFIFSLKKFIDNPAGVTFIISLPSIISLIVTPFCSFMSDRVWTRFGRRKPFVISSWIGCFTCIALLPVATNIWMLIGTFLLFNFFNDIGTGSNESLKQEVVPPKQRGVATALGKWLTNITQMLFALVAVGRFDDYQFYAGLPINGEQSLYWGVSAALSMILLLIAFGFKETKTPSKVLGERFTFRGFFGALLQNNLWPVYILITGYAIGKAGLGALGALLYTEQWGFTKQEMGLNMAVGGVINIFLIMILGAFADKLPRLKTYKVLILLSIIIEIIYFVYVEHILFDATPSLVEVILFGEIAAVVGILMGMIYFPLVYDYVPRNELGTYAAGATIVDKVVHIVTLNGVGVFITLWAIIFMPPGGEMTRVVTDQVMQESEVKQLLLEPEPIVPMDTPEALSVEAWYGTNARLDDGRAFEIRLANDDSVEMEEQRKKIEGEYNKALATKNNATFLIDRAEDEKEAAKQREVSDEYIALMAELRLKIEAIESVLQQRADAFETAVTKRLGEQLLPPQGQIRAAREIDVQLIRVRLNQSPEKKMLGRTLDALRALAPEVIDMTLVNEELNFYLELSLPAGSSVSESELLEAIEIAGRPRLEETLPNSLEVHSIQHGKALQLELGVIEDPINRNISPITNMVYALMSPFTDVPSTERRLWASARGLRDYRSTPHVRMADISNGQDYAVQLTAVIAPESEIGDATSDASSTITHLANLLNSPVNAPISIRAEDIYRRAIDATAANKLTIARTHLATKFTPPKYDYMSGYLWMISMSIIGYIITLYFTRRENKGLIRKRGREEADAEAIAEEENEARRATGGEDRTTYYTPGYVLPKIGIIMLGFIFVGLGMIQLGPKLTLFIKGEPTQAIATRIAKEKIGGERVWFDRDADVLAAKEKYDRSYVFWNEYAFNLPDGTRQTFVAAAGKQLEPVHYIRDKDGLPHIAKIWYDPDAPQKVLLPFVWSTWFLPGLLSLFGIIGISIGGCLLYFARKPIAMPLLPPEAVKD